MSDLIKKNELRKKLQTLSIKNFYLTHKFVSKNIDDYRTEKFFYNKKIFLKAKEKNLRILHVTNFNERLDGRLFLTLEEGLIMVLLDLDIVF